MKRENIYRGIILVMGILLLISFYGTNFEREKNEDEVRDLKDEQFAEEVSFGVERDSLLEILESYLQKDSLNAAHMDSMAEIMAYAASGNSINTDDGAEMYKTVLKFINQLENFEGESDSEDLLSYFHPSYSSSALDISVDNKVQFTQVKYPELKKNLEEAGNSTNFSWKMDIGALAYAKVQGRIGLLLMEGDVSYTSPEGESYLTNNIIQITLKKYENRWLIGHINSTRFAKE